MSKERQERAYEVTARAYREILGERKPEDAGLVGAHRGCSGG